jgi:hypothetical protein
MTSNMLYDKKKYPSVKYIGTNRRAGVRLPRQSEKTGLGHANSDVGPILKSN